VVVEIVAPDIYADAVVWLDSTRISTLNDMGTARLDIEIGKHELRIEKPGKASYSFTLHYTDTSSGTDRVVIPLPE